MKSKIRSVAGAVWLVLITIIIANGQAPLNKGDKLLKKMAYSDAIVRYENMVKKKPDNWDALTSLAQCYRLTNQYNQVEFTYARMMKIPGVPVQHKYNYALALIENGRYVEAKTWMQEYADETNDTRANDYLATLNNMQEFYRDSNNFRIYRLPINSLNADFSPALYRDGIVFASSRMLPGMITREHSWTGKPFLSLYYSKGKDGDFRTPESFAPDLKSKFNDGPVCFNKTGEVIYVTRNNVEKGRTKKSSGQVVKLKIFEAKNSDGNWKKISNFPYNSNEYNCGHPSLSADEAQLFFTSDMPGGYGGMDVYVCKKENGKWGKPVNLGSAINTKGNDIFPYVHEDGTLFFASDGHAGMGGLDIYSSKPENGVYASCKNMGAPINSNDDDFALIFDSKNKTGYFSSNRENRGGDDDIYSFSRTLLLRGIVVDRKTGKSIEAATVALTNPNTGQHIVTTLDDGKFSFPIDFDQQYTINGSKIYMGEDNESLNTSGMSPADEPFVKLELGMLFTLQVNVLDENTKEPIDLAILKLDNTDTLVGNTNTNGIYRQDLDANTTMRVLITKAGYNSKIISITNAGLTESRDLVYNVELKKGKDLVGFEDWNKIIYYDLDKYNIRPKDAVPTMEEVLTFMKENPNVIIRLNAHTDSRASVQYNILLSRRRAISAKNYLVNRGISANRIGDMIWTGESILVNQCNDGVYCPEPEHQLNRRTEITVMDIIRKKRNKD